MYSRMINVAALAPMKMANGRKMIPRTDVAGSTALRWMSVMLLAAVIAGCDGGPDRKAGRPQEPDGILNQGIANGEAVVTVYKSPTCGCCVKWAEYLDQHGFAVAMRDVDDLGEIKERFGVPRDLRSCHTATIDDGNYVLEGHVPAEDIERLLRTQPSGLLAVPGMPLGSPGMEHPRGSAAYDTVFVGDDGVAHTFQHHPGDE